MGESQEPRMLAVETLKVVEVVAAALRHVSDGGRTLLGRRWRFVCATATLAIAEVLVDKLGENARGPVRFAVEAIRSETEEALEGVG